MSGSDPPGGAGSTVASGAAADPAPRGEDRLAEGRLLAGRYRVTRFLAAGAMGEVYEAEDLELGERVALKRIRADKAERPAMVERFKRELQLARRVSHPAVCRIHELGFDREQDGELMFLTMELVRGETLADRLARDTRLPVDAALPIARQIAGGLDAAHAAGVIHRDLKSANVMLDGERAVVTDFGMAHRPADPGDDRLTADGALVGTPAYMAPEQVDGRPVSAATDIYSLGVLLFEMVTGRLPFAGASRMETAAKRLTEDAPRASSVVPGLDPRWDDAIARALEREPAHRFASAGELMRALTAPRTRAARVWIAGGLVAITAAVAAVTWWPASAPEPGAAARSEPRAIATLGFRNAGGGAGSAWLSTAIGEMLATELGSGDAVTVPADAVGRARIELGIDDADGYAPATLARIRRDLGCELVVSGSYAARAGRIRIEVRVQDAASGDTIAHASESGSEADLAGVVARIGERLRASLDIAAPAPGVSAMPQDADAARLYASGLARLRAFDPQGAVPLLDAAIAAAPRFAPAHAALARAWSELEDEVRAAASARRAFELADKLPREERLAIEAHHHATAGEWDRAIDAYRALIALRPADVDRRLDLARTQNQAGRSADAAATIAALRQLPAIADDPRIDLEHARATDDTEARLDLLQSAARKAEARGAAILHATALAEMAWDYCMGLGRLEDGLRSAEKAREILRAIGHRAGEWEVLNGLAPVVAGHGDYRRGAQLFDEAAGLAQSTGQRSRVVVSLGNAAFSYIMLGDLPAARERIARYRAHLDERSLPARFAYVERLEGWMRHEQGDLAGAQAHYATAVSLDPPVEEPLTCLALGQLAFDRGDLDVAGEQMRARLDVLRRSGDRAWAADTERNLARLALERGDAAGAEELLRSALSVDERADVVWATEDRALLAVAVHRQQRSGDARRLVEQALSSWSFAPPASRLLIGAAALEVIGDAAARARLDELRREAEAAGLRRIELEAALALAEHDHRRGWRSGERAAAIALARDARERGFVRIADRLAALGR